MFQAISAKQGNTKKNKQNLDLEKVKKAALKGKRDTYRYCKESIYDPERGLDLKIPERMKELSAILDAIDSKKDLSVNQIKMLASDRLTKMVRVQRFIAKMCKLIARTTDKKYFEEDDTQPDVEDFAYEAIMELAWRTASNIGFKKTQ